MTWNEADSSTFREIADVAVPRRAEMIQALVAVVPFDRSESFRIVELGSGDGRLAAALLEAFGPRAGVRPFNVAALDWWDAMFGAGLSSRRCVCTISTMRRSNTS